MSSHAEPGHQGEATAETGSDLRFRTSSLPRLVGMLAAIVVALPGAASANAPSGHYTVNAGSGTGNGTVYDTKSKLTWQQTGSALLVWDDAKTYCAGVGASLGGTGWRLPTLKELLSIVDYSQTTSPMIDPVAFPSTPASTFWSSSPYLVSVATWHQVDFTSGSTAISTAATGMGYVRCVR